MAGHSKWANIQHRKGAQDKKRGRLFAKLAKEITIAAKMGGGDVESNPRLRLAITTARGQSMPKDNIERAIKKGSGVGSDTTNYEEIRYEGYGPDGIAVIVEAMTDNQLGEITLDVAVADEEAMLEAVMEVGGLDVETTDDVHVVTCAMTDLNAVSTGLTEKFEEVKSAQIVWRAQNSMQLDLESTQKILKLVDALEDLDDVQSVYTSMDVSDEVASQL